MPTREQPDTHIDTTDRLSAPAPGTPAHVLQHATCSPLTPPHTQNRRNHAATANRGAVAEFVGDLRPISTRAQRETERCAKTEETFYFLWKRRIWGWKAAVSGRQGRP